MIRGEAEARIATAIVHLEQARLLLESVAAACRSAGLADDRGNVDAIDHIFDCIEEIEAEGLRLLK